MNDVVGMWLGWIGIILGVIGLFVFRYVLGGAAIVLGVIGLFSPKKGLNAVAILIGLIAVIIQMTMV